MSDDRAPALAMLESAFEMADEARRASGLPVMDDEQVVEYCDRIRREHTAESLSGGAAWQLDVVRSVVAKDPVKEVFDLVALNARPIAV